ncbi:MAG TPA: hypothetical protein VE669_01530 [Actinomycetota bacterium]|nr:hypothetical protein [Actinomycetota bacterium]
MGRRGFARSGVALIVLGLLAGSTPASAAANVRNGGFETGTFQGWARKDRGSGSWLVYSGTTLPAPAFAGGGPGPFPEPPRGQYAAVTVQGGPGAHLLHQRIRLAAGERHVLKFFIYWHNTASRWVNPHTFDFGGGGGAAGFQGGAPENPNQQFRVDVLEADAPLWTLNRKRILATVIRSKRDTRLIRNNPKAVVFDLSEFAGQRVRLRFAEVDNLGELNVAIDHVRVVG